MDKLHQITASLGTILETECMRVLFGCIFLLIGLLHGWHVANIEYGNVSDLNAGRFFSFSDLDRLASSGPVGKFLVLAIDGAIAMLGVLELTKKPK